MGVSPHIGANARAFLTPHAYTNSNIFELARSHAGQHRLPHGRHGALRRETEGRHADQRAGLQRHHADLQRDAASAQRRARVHRVHAVPAAAHRGALLCAAHRFRQAAGADRVRLRQAAGEHHADPARPVAEHVHVHEGDRRGCGAAARARHAGGHVPAGHW